MNLELQLLNNTTISKMETVDNQKTFIEPVEMPIIHEGRQK